jgi:DNA-binding transcriptional regulator YiaG
MKRYKDTKDMEEYLESHAAELVDADADVEELVRLAKQDNKARKARAASLQRLRRDKLKLSQSELARAIGANVRTLQSWETGRQDYPKAVEILMGLMHRIPGVKRDLLSPAVKKDNRAPVMKRKRRISTVKKSQSSKRSA